MIAENYACAYKEVIEVLKYTKREDVNKIPKSRILLWRINMNKDYDFKIDTTKTLEEQNLSKEAKAIIANIFKKYWYVVLIIVCISIGLIVVIKINKKRGELIWLKIEIK